MKIKIAPALVLLILAPVLGEVISGSTRLNDFFNPVTFLTEIMLYGCGALIIRELVLRWRKGWLAILLLGLAYGIFEEGVLVQSFFNPAWEDLGVLTTYGRVAGVNWVWTEHLMIFHALISISSSIAFVEMLYPDRHGDSWVKSPVWWILNWVALLAVFVLWKIVVRYDSGIWQSISWVSILLLVFLARLFPARLLGPVDRSLPHPRRFFWIALVAMFFQFLIVYGSVNRAPFLVPMIELVAFDGFMLFLVLGWNGNGAAWDDRHRMALIGGALSFFLLLGLLSGSQQYPIMYVSSPLLFVFLGWAYHKVNLHYRDSTRLSVLTSVQESR